MEDGFSIKSAVIVGSGNVAWVLGTALKHSGLEIKAICGRNKKSSQSLASELDTEYFDLKRTLPEADLVLITVSDDAIQEVSKELSRNFDVSTQLIAHTSGSKSSTLLQPFRNKASFYPLQTMTKGNIVDFSTVHFCIYATEHKYKLGLLNLGKKLSEHVHILDDKQRAVLHLSAVLVNNFANLFFAEAYKLSQLNQIDFELLRPLILKTARKAIESDPNTIQTGPAIRNDLETIDFHLDLLKEDKDLQVLYDLVSKRIKKNVDTQ
jgi:predicted short-subunit dehydrogenase-like oxidoreductase (DUF2520 family)